MELCRSAVRHGAVNLFLVVAFVFGLRVAVDACTVFFAFDGQTALAGQNEDWDDSKYAVLGGSTDADDARRAVLRLRTG